MHVISRLVVVCGLPDDSAVDYWLCAVSQCVYGLVHALQMFTVAILVRSRLLVFRVSFVECSFRQMWTTAEVSI